MLITPLAPPLTPPSASSLRSDLRYLYRPTRDRTPRWLRRIWTWL